MNSLSNLLARLGDKDIEALASIKKASSADQIVQKSAHTYTKMAGKKCAWALKNIFHNTKCSFRDQKKHKKAWICGTAKSPESCQPGDFLQVCTRTVPLL